MNTSLNLTAGYAELCRRISSNIHQPPLAVQTNGAAGDDLKLSALLTQGQKYGISVQQEQIMSTGNGENNNNVLRLGWDPGYAANKLALIRAGQLETFSLPSSVGEANRSKKDGLSLGGVVRPQHRRRRPYQVAFDDLEFLVGPGVADYTEPIDRMDFDRFTDSPELRATFYAGVYRLINGGPHRLAVVVALPVEVVQDKGEAARVERGLRDWLVGQHSFSVDGVDTVITVETVRARVPQPVATWFDWGLNLEGQWPDSGTATAPTLVIDQGFNTLDVLVVEKGRISERFSEGDTLGMRRAAERLIRTVKNKYGVTLELHTAAELVQTVVNGRPAEIHVNGQLTDIKAETRQALKALAAEVHNFLDRTAGKHAAAYKVLLTGGGAIALRETLLRQFPAATVMHEPVLANARGLAKLANRPGFLE